MKTEENTFGDYTFPEWVPEQERETIRSFWGWANRTHKDWIESRQSESMPTCNHGPGPNGFGHPPMGATCDYMINDYKLSKENNADIFRVVRGKYIHRWNNIGTLVDEFGECHHVSSCNRWVRVWQEGEDKNES